jgi:hypothetical protein
MIPSNIKKAALTELPMIPPIVLKLSNFDETAAAVAATTMEVMMTILLKLDNRIGYEDRWEAYVE